MLLSVSFFLFLFFVSLFLTPSLGLPWSSLYLGLSVFLAPCSIAKCWLLAVRASAIFVRSVPLMRLGWAKGSVWSREGESVLTFIFLWLSSLAEAQTGRCDAVHLLSDILPFSHSVLLSYTLLNGNTNTPRWHTLLNGDTNTPSLALLL